MGAEAVWTAVVPVKPTRIAKSRLTTDSALRTALALAFALDTVAALRSACLVSSVVVVTDDTDVRGALGTTAGVALVDDEPDAGLNAALLHGVAHARAFDGQAPVAMLSADLPALRPGEVDRVLVEAARHPAAFVPDATGTGTTLLTAAAHVAPAPGFGPRSRATHRAGAHEITGDDVATVRQDVDTWADLTEAVRLGVGAATRAVLRSRRDVGPVGSA